jgi:tRNA1(Val) A37 N6-methylase TrmN6
MLLLSPKRAEVRQEIVSLFVAVPNDALDRWGTLLWESSGIDPTLRLPAHDQIAKSYGITLPDSHVAGTKLLFAVQTFFAGVVKKVSGLELTDPFFDWAKSNLPTDPQYRLQRHADQFDLFGAAYRNLYPASVRKALGEFYTPDWLAAFLIDQLDCYGEMILDPSCGSGVFLIAAAKKMLQSGFTADEILRQLCGFDLNPLAVLMTKANLALLLNVRDEQQLPVFHRDSILDETPKKYKNEFNLIGNPPWLNWDRLPKEYREKTKPLWEHYGLFNLTGSAARHGGAKKELALLMILRTADQFLKSGGRLGMVLPVSVFQTRHAGQGFRKFRLPDGTPLRVQRVDDFSELPKNPFENVGTKPATIRLKKGAETEYPVAWFRWQTNCDLPARFFAHGDQAGSAWIVNQTDKQSFGKSSCKSDYKAYLGANSGGANGIFWLEILGESKISPQLVRVRNLAECGKLPIPRIEADIEKEIVFPLLCWGDIGRFEHKLPSRFILMPQDIERRVGMDEDRMSGNFPFALNYLKRFEPELRQRAAFRKYQSASPFYSMYNVGWQSVAPIKIVWRRMDTMLRATIVETFNHPILGSKPMIPQETCVLIPCGSMNEAKYLVETLNSDSIQERIRSLCLAGSKGFGSPGILDFLGIRNREATL